MIDNTNKAALNRPLSKIPKRDSMSKKKVSLFNISMILMKDGISGHTTTDLNTTTAVKHRLNIDNVIGLSKPIPTISKLQSI